MFFLLLSSLILLILFPINNFLSTCTWNCSSACMIFTRFGVRPQDLYWPCRAGSWDQMCLPKPGFVLICLNKCLMPKCPLPENCISDQELVGVSRLQSWLWASIATKHSQAYERATSGVSHFKFFFVVLWSGLLSWFSFTADFLIFSSSYLQLKYNTVSVTSRCLFHSRILADKKDERKDFLQRN